MRRFGQVLNIEPACIDAYTRHHVKIWPEIADAIAEAGIRNYSIYLFGDKLFGYYEYVGPHSEYEARMSVLAQAPRMREWWDLMEPMQKPLAGRKAGEWWATMDEVFHQD